MIDKLQVFMVMPFSNEIADNNYSHSVKPLCENLNLEIRRADEIFGTSPIYEDIVKEIQEASVIIVDITDKNPNVFYELGMTHTLKQSRTVMITQDKFDELPFDIAHFRIISYQNSIKGKVEFEKKLSATLLNLLSDRKETFKKEFELTFDIFMSSSKHSDLFGLIGIKQYNGILKKNMHMQLEGEYPGGESRSSHGSIENSFKAMEKLEYVKYVNNIISLTDKGEAFVEFLKEQKVNCHQLNDQTFTENYRNMQERYLERQKRLEEKNHG